MRIIDFWSRVRFAGEGAGGAAAAAAADPAAAAAGAGAGAGGAAGGSTAAAAAGDRAWLPEPYRADPVFANFKSVDDLAKEHREVQKVIGADKIPLPGKDAKPEDWDRVYAKLGRPEAPDKYDLQGWAPPKDVPWDGELQKSMLGVMHKAGLNSTQVKALMSAYGEAAGTSWTAMQAKATQSATQAEAALRGEWGNGYDANVAKAGAAWKYLLGDQAQALGTLKLADGSNVGDHPALVKAFAKMADLVGERGELPDGANLPNFGVLTPEAAKKAIAELEGSEPYRKVMADTMHPERAYMMAKRERLYQQAYPDQNG